MANPPTPLQPPNPYAAAALAAHRKAQGTLRIYHSCDPPNTPLLHHYKAGKYTPPAHGSDPNYPTETALIPKRYGNTQTVLRCARGVGAGCLTCILTEYEATDLSLEVARAHGIRGAYVRPSPRAKTVEARIQDGVARGRVMHRDATAEELGDRAARVPGFHPRAGGCRKVLRWLEKVPGEAEVGSSWPVFGESPETAAATNKDSLYIVPGLGKQDVLKVGAEWSTPMMWRESKNDLHGRPVSRAVPQNPVTATAPLREKRSGGQTNLDGHAGHGHSGIEVEPIHESAAGPIYMGHTLNPMAAMPAVPHVPDLRNAGYSNLHAQSWSPEGKVESGCGPKGFPGFGPDEHFMATATAPLYGLGIGVDAVDVSATHRNIEYNFGPWNDDAQAAPVMHHPSFTATTTTQLPYVRFSGGAGQLGEYVDWQSYRANVETPNAVPAHSPFSNHQPVPDYGEVVPIDVPRGEKRMLEDAGVAAQARRKRARYDDQNGGMYYWNRGVRRL